jgi:hypothetical protein
MISPAGDIATGWVIFFGVDFFPDFCIIKASHEKTILGES